MQKNSKPRGGVRGKNKCQPIAYSKPVCKTKGGWLSVKFGHCRWYNVYMIQQHSGNMSQNMMEINGCASEYGGQKIYEPSILTQETLQRCGQENHLGFVWKIMGKHGQPNNPIVYHHPSYKNAILVYTTFSDIPKFWTVSWTWRNCFLEAWVRQRNQIHRSGGWISEVSTYEHVRHCSWIKNYEDPTKGSELAFLEKKDSTDDAG